MEKKDIKSYSLEELKIEIGKLGEKAFRAKQIYGWLHEKLVSDFSEMGNIPKHLLEKLEERYELVCLKPVEILSSRLDGTQKFLFELYDGNVIESVLMRYKHGNSVCISSQVGCRMGCKFCASTIGGLERNLRVSEMLDQIYRIQVLSGERVSNVVLMGTGEPMDNYEAVVKLIKMLSDEEGLHISQRNLTVSTCGLIPEIRRLAEEKLQITLALSLHAPNDQIRQQLMPVAQRYGFEDVVEACKYYFKRTGRRITFEYSLVKGVNDSAEAAVELADKLKGINCHVNLIPVNPIKERNFKQSELREIESFKNKLEKSKINVTIRRELGRDIQGACGQLRKSYTDSRREER